MAISENNASSKLVYVALCQTYGYALCCFLVIIEMANIRLASVVFGASHLRLNVYIDMNNLDGCAL